MAEKIDVKAKLLEMFPELEEDENVVGTDACFVVPGERLLEVARACKETPGIECNYLSNITGVDYQDHLQSVYHLFGLDTGVKITLKVNVPRDNPEVESVTSLWPTANWHEREAYDLVGIVYKNHPDLRRILLMDKFEGHPLRKDFVDTRPKRKRKVRVR